MRFMSTAHNSSNATNMYKQMESSNIKSPGFQSESIYLNELPTRKPKMRAPRRSKPISLQQLHQLPGLNNKNSQSPGTGTHYEQTPLSNQLSDKTIDKVNQELLSRIHDMERDLEGKNKEIVFWKVENSAVRNELQQLKMSQPPNLLQSEWMHEIKTLKAQLSERDNRIELLVSELQERNRMLKSGHTKNEKKTVRFHI